MISETPSVYQRKLSPENVYKIKSGAKNKTKNDEIIQKFLTAEVAIITMLEE